MKENKYFLNTALAAVLGIAVLVAIFTRTFFPIAVIPALDIPSMTALSLLALLIDHYFAKGAKRCYVCVIVLSAVTFGLLPFAAGFVTVMEALKLAGIGCAVFTVATLLFGSIQNRLSTGPAAKAAPILSALGLYLAAQVFAGFL